ncbi:hypothetical protein E4T38_00036 [Aureobasidium subglaciale]|nr:hypothetical protein E4T38_00036 [Aureobasidium subglaciale]KAI5232481.1 hypothetical protein E4T40_00036 [Aureobasidium subglaciale]KAI5234702.1 hypothetical protein E4T41_00036 [Aureobasidium subglaciale]KAI5268248.1 hypothetical protein E4T46_00036 [Aureobasidium subglaciale]
MPPTRKAHHKSRNGCNQCKKRHVKCDEVRPHCGNCVKREATCSFSTGEQSPPNGQEEPESPTNVPEARQQVLSRAEEMDLIHFFTTTTTKTVCHDPKDWHLWEHGIPGLAFQNEYLLDALLALTCLHRSRLHPLRQQFWVRCAIEYENRALPGFFKVLSDVNDETCHAAFAFSFVTTLVEIAMPRGDIDPIEHLVGMRNYFRGTAILYLTKLDALRCGAMNSFFLAKTITWEYDPELRRSLHDRVTALYDIVAGSRDEKIYNETIALLLRLFYDSPYAIISFSLLVGPDFFQLVCQREPMAVLIYIYCGVAFNNVNEWWCDGLGKRIVNGLTLPEETLEDSPMMASALSWAKQQVMKVPESNKVIFWRIFDAEHQVETVETLLHPDDPLHCLRSNDPSTVNTPDASCQRNGTVQDKETTE